MFLGLITTIFAQTPYFSSPANGTVVVAGQSVNITMQDVRQGTRVNVTQICGGQQSSNTLGPGNIVSFTIPSPYSGFCNYTAIATPTSQSAIVPLYLIVQGTVTIVDPTAGANFTPGSIMPVKLDYQPRTTPDPDFNVTLQCSNNQTSQIISGADVVQPFIIPADFYGSTNDCKVFISNSPNYLPLNNVSISVFEPLIIESPEQGSNYTVAEPFPVLVSSTDPLAVGSYSAQFNCGQGPSFNVTDLSVNVPTTVTLNSTYFGNCTMQVYNVSGSFGTPSPITFNLKYNLAFLTSPSLVIGNIPFTIYLQATPTPDISVPSTVSMDLICDSGIIESWPSVTIGSPQQLTINSQTFSEENCYFETQSNSTSYYQAIASVSVTAVPTGGQAYPITDEEIRIFLETNTIIPPIIDFYLEQRDQE